MALQPGIYMLQSDQYARKDNVSPSGNRYPGPIGFLLWLSIRVHQTKVCSWVGRRAGGGVQFHSFSTLHLKHSSWWQAKGGGNNQSGKPHLSGVPVVSFVCTELLACLNFLVTLRYLLGLGLKGGRERKRGGGETKITLSGIQVWWGG